MITVTRSTTVAPLAKAESIIGYEHRIEKLHRAIEMRRSSSHKVTKINGTIVSEVTASIINNRLHNHQKVDQYLNPKHYPSFYGSLLPDIERFVELLKTDQLKQNGIYIVCDYDVDGTTAAAQISYFLKVLKIPFQITIPDRLTDGFGVKQWMVEEAKNKGFAAFLTLDCGTANVRQIKSAAELGLKPIVIDHHAVLDEVPPGIIINPHRGDYPEDLTERCASGLVHDITNEALTRLGIQNSEYYELSKALATLGTVADVVPLYKSNRVLVAQGLEALSKTKHAGLRALQKVSRVFDELTSENIGFHLGPRINATGRMESGYTSYRLLTSDCEVEAKRLATELDQRNIERRETELHVLKRAYQQAVSNFPNSEALVLYDPAFHFGIVGIVAARLMERFNCPSLVLCDDIGDSVKGSMRCPQGIDGLKLLEKSAKYLQRYGGHARAGGVQLKKEHLDQFREIFLSATVKQKNKLDVPKCFVDAEIELKDLDQQFLNEIVAVEPCGEGNPRPIVKIKNITIDNVRAAGQNSSVVEVSAKGIKQEIFLPGIPSINVVRKDTIANLAVSVCRRKISGVLQSVLELEAVEYC